MTTSGTDPAPPSRQVDPSLPTPEEFAALWGSSQPRPRLWPVCQPPEDCPGHTPACLHGPGNNPLSLACRDCITERQATGLVFCLTDDAEVHQFIWEDWTEEQRSEHMERVNERQHRYYRRTSKPDRPMACTCVDWCGESSEAGCPDCVQRDIYDPCPAVGFGCGWSSGNAARCDCCTDEQWAAAACSDARLTAKRPAANDGSHAHG